MMSQDICKAIDGLGQRLDSRLEVVHHAIGTVGDKIVTQIALLYAPVGEEKEEERIPSDKQPQIFFELDTRLRNLGDSFSRIVTEAEWAKRNGRLRDNSFDIIAMTWSDCKRGSYSKLLAYAPSAKAALPSLEEHFSNLGEGAKELDIAINTDNRGALLRAVENFDGRLRSLQEEARKIPKGLPKSSTLKGGQADD